MPPQNTNRQRSSEEKPLPQDLNAERAVLGSVILDVRALREAFKIVSSADFFLESHKRIFSCMLRLVEADSVPDLVTITVSLHNTGELELAGGAAYVGSLADGMPRVSNVSHYAKIVRDLATRRNMIHQCAAIQDRAWEGEEPSETLVEWAATSIKASGNGHCNDNPLVAVDVLDFLDLKLDPIDFVIEPILPVSNSAMIFSPTGAGKTYIMLHMAYSVAIGFPKCFVWDVAKPRPVVYVDGEMDQLTLQERQSEIAKGIGHLPERGKLKIITPDQQPKFPPRMDTKDGRARIEEYCVEGGLLVLDNISTLCPGGDDKESENWSVTQEWILALRRRRVSVFLVHHAGKSGDQLGTSKKEVQLSCNLKLRTASEYTPEDGLRVSCHITKLRRRGLAGRMQPAWVQPFEITYRVVDGAAEFSTRPMMEILRKKAVQMLLAGMRENDVAQETGLNRFQIYRLNRKIKAEGQAAAELSD